MPSTARASVRSTSTAPVPMQTAPPTLIAGATEGAAKAPPTTAPTEPVAISLRPVDAESLSTQAATSGPTPVSERLVDVVDFELVAYQGEKLLGGERSQFSRVFRQGQPVVLNFWAGKCPPCRLEMPGFQRVYARYKGEVIFVGVDVGTFTGLGTNEDARRLLQDLEVTYPSAYAVDPGPLIKYGVQTMPTTLFFSRQGKLVYRHVGDIPEDRLRSIVLQLAVTS